MRDIKPSKETSETTAAERIYTALSGGTPDRIPVLPKIWVDLAAALTGVELSRVIEEPALAIKVVVDAAMAVGADAARVFHFPARKTLIRDYEAVEVDKKGRTLGKIDMQGGLATRMMDRGRIRLEDPYHMAFVQFMAADGPLVENLNDVRRIAVPRKRLYEDLGFGSLQRSLVSEVSGRIALLGDCASATLAFCVLYRRLDNALLDLVENPRLIHALMEKGTEIAVEKGKFNIDTGLKMLRLNDSVANMTVISPPHWREFVYPHMKTVCDELHSYDPGVRIYCHICGNVMPIIEDLIAVGLDCIGPLDPLGNFTCAEARAAVRDRAALMGGVNTLTFVEGSPEDIIAESRLCMEGAGGTGYILGSGCVVPRTAKRENLLALSEAASAYGRRAPADT